MTLSERFEADGDQPGQEPVAIIDMGCRLPGGIDSPETLWRHLTADGDTVGRIPDDRWA